MESAGRVYAQNPDPDTKLGDLETMELNKLKILQNRYKNIVNNRALLSRLKDRGESARRTLAAVETELATRGTGADGDPPPLESRRAAAAEVDRLAQKMAQMEWNSEQRPVSAAARRADLDGDDDSEPEVLPGIANSPSHTNDSPSHTTSASSRTTQSAAADTRAGPGSGTAAATTRQLLSKSATSRRQTRFATNRARDTSGEAPKSPLQQTSPPPPPGPARRGVLSQWSDSALAAPVRPDTHTRLLDMDESLRLLTHHNRITQEERSAQLAARYAALVDMEGGHIDADAGSDDAMEDDADTGPVVIIAGDAT